jgi:hypothetical protein
MVSVFSILAEVADKEFSVATLWIVAAILSAVAFALSRWRRWATIIALPPILIWIWFLLSEIHDRFVGPAILAELGRAYFVQTYLSALLPVAFLLAGLYRERRAI